MKFLITSTSSWGDFEEDENEYLPILKKYGYQREGCRFVRKLVNQASRDTTLPTIEIETIKELEQLILDLKEKIVVEPFYYDETKLLTIEIYDGWRE